MGQLSRQTLWRNSFGKSNCKTILQILETYIGTSSLRNMFESDRGQLSWATRLENSLLGLSLKSPGNLSWRTLLNTAWKALYDNSLGELSWTTPGNISWGTLSESSLLKLPLSGNYIVELLLISFKTLSGILVSTLFEHFLGNALGELSWKTFKHFLDSFLWEILCTTLLELLWKVV